MGNRTPSDIIGSLRREAQANSHGDLMLAAADELDRLRSLLDESTAKWSAFSHDCYGTHYMLPEGGVGVYLDGYREKRRLDEIRALARLPELPPPPLPKPGTPWPMKLTWLAVYDPASGFKRATSWTGASREVVVTGVALDVWRECPLVGFEAPATALVHIPEEGASATDLAIQVGGVVLTEAWDWESEEAEAE